MKTDFLGVEGSGPHMQSFFLNLEPAKVHLASYSWHQRSNSLLQLGPPPLHRKKNAAKDLQEKFLSL